MVAHRWVRGLAVPLAGLVLAACAPGPTGPSGPAEGISWAEACPSLADDPVEQLAATSLPDGTVELTWFDGYVVGGFSGRLYRQADGGPWDAVADVTVADGGAARYVDAAPPSGAVRYRLRRVLDCDANGVVEGDPVRAGVVEDDAVTASPAPDGWRSPATTLAEHCAAIRPRDVRAEVTPDGVLVSWYDGEPPDSDTYAYGLLRRAVGTDDWEVVNGLHAPVDQTASGTGGDPPLRSFLDVAPPSPLPEYGVEHDDGPCYPVEVVSAGVPAG